MKGVVVVVVVVVGMGMEKRRESGATPLPSLPFPMSILGALFWRRVRPPGGRRSPGGLDAPLTHSHFGSG